jgi:hypothetical protein
MSFIVICYSSAHIYLYTIMVVIVVMVIMNVYDDGDSYDDDNDIYL